MPGEVAFELPKRLPLALMPENRDDTTHKDAKLVNCYLEREQDKDLWIYERVGLARQSQPSGGAAAGQGCYNWLGHIYSAFGGHLYKDGVDKGVIDATGGVYRFDSCLGATPKLQLGNAVKAYNYDDGAGLVEITDGDFPHPFLKGWSYLDGTTYVGTPDAHIQGSDINDPVNWDALNSILAQIEPDAGVALAKQLVYTVMMKQWTTEIFFDAGNATGSPLGPVQGAKVPYGCVSADSVQEIDDVLFWAATTRGGSVQIIQMAGVKAESVSSKAVERLLDHVDFTTCYSFTFKNDGHKFYVLTVVAANITVVYDITERSWSQWTDKDGNYFPYVAATFTNDLKTIFQHATNGRLYYASSDYATDDGDLIVVDLVTPNFDGGIRRQKMLSKLEVIGDQKPGCFLQIRHNDHDYDPAKWSGWRTVDMGQRRPYLDDCGTFYRRVHQLHYAVPARMPRIQAIELQMALGTL